MPSIEKATDYWAEQTRSGRLSACSWMSCPEIREHINRQIGGRDEPKWPLEWFAAEFGRRQFRRALSIGCGSGALERSALALNLCETIDAFDGSIYSLKVAAQKAATEGLSHRIRYYAADFNRPTFPRHQYDLILCHQSLHHVGKLEKLFAAAQRALNPGGVFYFDEYVGPSRDEWNDDLLRELRETYSQIPPEARTRELFYPPIAVDDPSEAARSSEIMKQFQIGFEVLRKVPYGGWILAPIYQDVRWDHAPDGLLSRLITLDTKRSEEGRFTYVIVAGSPRTGAAGLLALLRYWWTPKIKYSLKHTVLPGIVTALRKLTRS